MHRIGINRRAPAVATFKFVSPRMSHVHYAGSGQSVAFLANRDAELTNGGGGEATAEWPLFIPYTVLVGLTSTT